MIATIRYKVERSHNDWDITAYPEGRAPYRLAGYIERREDAKVMARALNVMTREAEARPGKKDHTNARRNRGMIKAIVKILDGETWSPDTLDQIAAVLRAEGYDIREVEEGAP